ncbi:hypothetical protein L1D15_13700 [Vibrio sp. Isolate25]|uniref:hypothetical protein n=1 Tax=Vibrio sp. Isolate25 TaxID=2908535 RepID=UPI001EFD44E6|nr:hypothetical protein [Vibrio sp. Isolate25]MCG9597771.1 hypothetical protein [Vibrio sp. Isolate25]
MNIKKVLFLDDGNINQTITRIRDKVKRLGFDICADVINPQDQKYKSNFDGVIEIDFSKIKKDVTDNYKENRYEIVACDFSFASEKLNGYELIRWVINESKSSNFAFKKAKFVCYSSEENKFKEHILRNDELTKLIKLNIHAFYKRDNLVNDMSALLKKINSEFSMSEHLATMLEDEPQRVFNNVYPPLKGKSFNEIASEIQKDSHHGQRFQKHLSELVYAHIIDLNQ